MKTIVILISVAACLALRADNVGPSVTVLQTNVVTRPIRMTVTTTTVRQVKITPVTVDGKQSWLTNLVGVVSETSVTNAQVFGGAALKGTNVPQQNRPINRPPGRPR